MHISVYPISFRTYNDKFWGYIVAMEQTHMEYWVSLFNKLLHSVQPITGDWPLHLTYLPCSTLYSWLLFSHLFPSPYSPLELKDFLLQLSRTLAFTP